MTNSSGAVDQVLDYFPFGDIRLNVQNSAFDEEKKFGGHYYDTDTDLTYFGARYYSGKTGRFLSQDPVFLSEGGSADPQRLNSYAYGKNNPVAFVDVDGREPSAWQRYFLFSAYNRREMADGWRSVAGFIDSTVQIPLDPGTRVAAGLTSGVLNDLADAVDPDAPAWRRVVGVASIAATVATLGEAAEARGALGSARQIGAELKATDTAVRRMSPNVIGELGEGWMGSKVGGVRKYFRTGLGGRIIDRWVELDRAGFEAKVGYKSLTMEIRTQIAKDAWLLKNKIASEYTWYFYRSPVTGLAGASQPLLDELAKAGIKFVIMK